MDKFTLRVNKKPNGFKPCIIDVDTHEKLKQLSDETGISMTRIIEQAVCFAMDRLEVKED